MKLHLVLENLDKSKRNKETVNLAELMTNIGMGECDIDYSIPYEDVLEEYYIFDWRCTDRKVGTSVLYYNGTPFCVCTKTARKGMKIYKFIQGVDLNQIKNYLYSLIYKSEYDYELEYISTDAEIEEYQQIYFLEQTVRHRTIYHDGIGYRYDYRKVNKENETVILDDKEIKLSECKFRINVINNVIEYGASTNSYDISQIYDNSEMLIKPTLKELISVDIFGMDKKYLYKICNGVVVDTLSEISDFLELSKLDDLTEFFKCIDNCVNGLCYSDYNRILYYMKDNGYLTDYKLLSLAQYVLLKLKMGVHTFEHIYSVILLNFKNLNSVIDLHSLLKENQEKIKEVSLEEFFQQGNVFKRINKNDLIYDDSSLFSCVNIFSVYTDDLMIVYGKLKDEAIKLIFSKKYNIGDENDIR